MFVCLFGSPDVVLLCFRLSRDAETSLCFEEQETKLQSAAEFVSHCLFML